MNENLDADDKATRGLEARYEVTKLNDPTGKHRDCRVFVLDPQHDPIARKVLMEYARLSIADGADQLGVDLIEWIGQIELREHHPSLAAELDRQVADLGAKTDQLAETAKVETAAQKDGHTVDVGYVHVLTEEGGPCAPGCPHPDHHQDLKVQTFNNVEEMFEYLDTLAPAEDPRKWQSLVQADGDLLVCQLCPAASATGEPFVSSLNEGGVERMGEHLAEHQAEIGGDECGELQPGDENLPLAKTVEPGGGLVQPGRRCPIHGIPDCSPLLNGCSIVIDAKKRAEERAEHVEVIREPGDGSPMDKLLGHFGVEGTYAVENENKGGYGSGCDRRRANFHASASGVLLSERECL